MIVLLLCISGILLSTSAAPPPLPQAQLSPPPSPGGCSDELVAFSVCLPYISASPNNLTDFPSSQCCNKFASTFSSGDAICLCYLFQRPLILGFPLNTTNLLSLATLCPLNFVKGSPQANVSLDALCSGSSRLPPLQSIKADEERSRHRRPGPHSPPAPTRISPPKAAKIPSTPFPDTGLPADPSLSIPPAISFGSGMMIKKIKFVPSALQLVLLRCLYPNHLIMAGLSFRI